MTLAVQKEEQKGPGIKHTVPGTHFPSLFSRDTEMSPKSLDSNYKEELESHCSDHHSDMWEEGTEWPLGRFPLDIQLMCGQRLPIFPCPQGLRESATRFCGVEGRNLNA